MKVHGSSGWEGVSLIIPVCNQIDYTQQLLRSLDKHTTSVPCEIIVIDNGSTDDSANLCAAAGCIVIRNETNLGCARAWNQGIKRARGSLLVIMNNDMLVTEKWLSRLLDFKLRRGIEIVSPSMINGILDYDLDQTATEFHSRFSQRCWPAWHPSCFLAHRSTFELIGSFDESFTGGGLEDDDYDIRLRLHGASTATTGAVLIHHFSQVTQKALAGTAWKKNKNPNKTRLEQKWGWHLIFRRIQKEGCKFKNRVRYPAQRGRNPNDIHNVGADEILDLEVGRKTLCAGLRNRAKQKS